MCKPAEISREFLDFAITLPEEIRRIKRLNPPLTKSNPANSGEMRPRQETAKGAKSPKT
jgi:hypothetical protein